VDCEAAADRTEHHHVYNLLGAAAAAKGKDNAWLRRAIT
jgi:hypothetical protein